MDPVIGAAIIGGASSLIENIFGSSNQSSANKTNLQIAQMNNEFNERMLSKQNEYNLGMLQKQFDYDTKKMEMQNSFQREQWAYNSAAQQRKRLEAAGLNPYMMMSGGNAGIAQSASGTGGSPSANSLNVPTATPAQVQPYRPDFSGLNSVIAGYMDYLKTRDVNAAQARHINIENGFLAQRLEADIANMWENTKRTRSETQKINTETGRMMALLPHEINNLQSQWENARLYNSVIQADIICKHLDAQLSAKSLATYDEKFRAEMAVYAADAYQKVQAGLLSNKEAELAVEKKLTEIEMRNGIEVDNKVKKDTSYWLIRSARWAAIEQSWNAQSAKNAAQKTPVFTDPVSQGWNKFINTWVAPLGGAVWGTAAGYGAAKYSQKFGDNSTRGARKQLKKILK